MTGISATRCGAPHKLAVVAILLFALAQAALASEEELDNSKSGRAPAAFIQAQTCCIGCSYSNPTNCCCGKRKAVTRTTTVVSTVTKGRQFRAEVAPLVRDLRRRSVNNEVTLSENEDFDEVPSIISRLFGRQKDSGRHLCPVCPTGATIRTNGTSGTFCCPRAAPTIWKTKTRFVTKTAKTSKTSGTVGRVATITGRVWIDLNRNNKFDLGVDIPYSYTPVSLIKPSAVGKRGLEERAPLNSVLGNTTTDCEGNFRFFTATPEDNKLLWVTLQTDMSKPLKTLQTDSRGFGAALVPLPAALPVTVTSTVYSLKNADKHFAHEYEDYKLHHYHKDHKYQPDIKHEDFYVKDEDDFDDHRDIEHLEDCHSDDLDERNDIRVPKHHRTDHIRVPNDHRDPNYAHHRDRNHVYNFYINHN